MTAYELGGQGSISKGRKDFFSPLSPDRIYRSPSACQELFLFFFSKHKTNFYRCLLPQTLRMSGINLYFRSLNVHREVSIMEKWSSKMSHPRCVYINNRCRYQSLTQQYLKRCLIKDDYNYMFRPIADIIRFSSERMVVVLYMIGMVMSRLWDLTIVTRSHHRDEISPLWHNHTNHIKHYHHTFGWKPDDGCSRPKHVVTIILY